MPSFEIDLREDDDADLITQVSLLISGVAKTNAYSHYAVARIDNWFDDKWAGFPGVYREYHDQFVKGTYSVISKNRILPPFTGSRIKALQTVGEPQKNLAAVFYLSTNVRKNQRASLLASIPLNKGDWQWYVGFKYEDDHWKAIRHRNISHEDVKLYIASDA